SNQRPARTDHTFIWKQKSVNLGDGSLRVEAGVDGDQIASYSEYVKVPEQWSRDYEKMRSRNNMAQVVDEVLWIALSVAMAVVLILRLVRRAGLPRGLPAPDFPPPLLLLAGAALAVVLHGQRGGDRADVFLFRLSDRLLSCGQQARRVGAFRAQVFRRPQYSHALGSRALHRFPGGCF